MPSLRVATLNRQDEKLFVLNAIALESTLRCEFLLAAKERVPYVLRVRSTREIVVDRPDRFGLLVSRDAEAVNIQQALTDGMDQREYCEWANDNDVVFDKVVGALGREAVGNEDRNTRLSLGASIRTLLHVCA